MGIWRLQSGSCVKESDIADAIQTILQRCKCGTLRKKHEDAIEAFVKVGVSFWFEKLETKVCGN